MLAKFVKQNGIKKFTWVEGGGIFSFPGDKVSFGNFSGISLDGNFGGCDRSIK